MRAAEGRVVVAMAREDTGSAAVVERAVAREAAVMAEVTAVATAAATVAVRAAAREVVKGEAGKAVVREVVVRVVEARAP